MSLNKKIVYCSWHELDMAEARRSSEKIFFKNYISEWAKKLLKYDPDGSKADALAEKYSKK